MEKSVKEIKEKINNFKICLKCNTINWHKNKECLVCENTAFYCRKEIILELLKDEHNYHVEKFNKTEEEIENTTRLV